MAGVAQVWLSADELHALVKVSTEKGATLSRRMAGKILPKLESARNAVGCPVPFEQIPGQTDLEEVLAELEPHEPIYGGY